ncbi:hypothetical protein BDV19DRAFT_354487 [Aspergillus venezuelensis]
MFRKKRSNSQHRHQHQLSTPNSQNAQSAATRAFAQSQSPSSSLSSAAAAAALRSLTSTPTPVENVQTRRMLQRQSSISSQPVGSPTLRPSSRNGLRRVNSSASMSARTFRDQSPGRPTSSYSTMSTMSTPAVAPPLPSIPPEFSGRKTQSRRSVSLGPSTWSPSPPIQTPDRSRPDKARSVISPVNAPGSPRTIGSPDAVPSSPLHQRSESRNSINFSYPMNSRTNSPTIPSGVSDRPEAASGAAASLNKRSSAHFNHTRAARLQSHNAKGGSSAAGARSALAAAQAVITSRNDEPEPEKVSPRPARRREQPVVERSPSRSPGPVDAKSRTPVKKPSPLAEEQTVKERPKSIAMTEQPQPAPVKKQSQTVPAKEEPKPAPVKEQSQPIPVKEQENRPLTKDLPVEQPPRPSTPPISEKIVRTPPVSPPQAKSSPLANFVVNADEVSQPALRQLSSPVRAAHFPSQLTVAGNEIHQPPPRSLSPAKSAMKNRTSSLSPDGRLSGILRPGPPLSEISDATSVASDDGVRPGNRKKSAKVSFDDEAEIVGVAASPPTSPDDTLPASPPGKSKSKTSWFSLHKRKTSPPRAKDNDDFDGILKPRAALPSFGSVRPNKDGAKQDTTAQPDVNGDDSTSESDDEFPNGYAINSVISRASDKDEQKQVPADALPAEPTVAAARDGAGTQEEPSPMSESDSEPAYFHKTQLSPLPEVPSDQNLPLNEFPLPQMPDITLQPATPDPEKGRASLDEWDSPEEYPRQSVEEAEGSTQKKGRRRSYGESDNGNDSSSSVYSDAEEDLDEDLDGDGFGSINAIVEHGPEQSPPGQAITSTSQGETRHADQELNTTEIPETCQIARVETPLEDSKPSTSTSPSFIEPLPVSTISPPRTGDKATPQTGIARSSTVPVEVYAIAQARDDDPKEVDTRYSQVDSPGVNAQRSKSQQRPETSAPSKRKEVRSPDADQLNGAGAPGHHRQLSNGSDSESSFRRVRRGSRGGMGMRRTLRGQQSSSVPAEPNRIPAPIDPPLPTGLGAGTMRTTLRGNSKKEKPSFFSTGKSQKAAQKGRPAREANGAFASRFPDSDSDYDSDNGVQGRRLQRPMHRPTRSMSDNDMRPVRGIPRRKDAYDGDSTELEDSSDGERRPSSAPRTTLRQSQPKPPTVRDPALAAVAKSRGMTEDELEELLRGPSGSSRKPNILNRLSLKKSKPAPQRGKLQPSDLLSNGAIPEHSEPPQSPPQVANGNTKSVGSPSRLLKKSLHKKSPSGDSAWPLGSERSDAVDSGIGSTSSPSASTQPARPSTPNGNAVNGNKAAPVQPDSQPSQDEPSSGHRAADVGFEGGGRKKRFSRLKKAFGIGK